MKSYKLNIILIFICITVVKSSQVYADDPDFKVTVINNPAPGYLLFDWQGYSDFAFVDNYGFRVLNQTTSNNYKAGYYKLLNNGLWAAYAINKYYLYNQDFVLVDSIKVPTNLFLDFHDVISLSNGNYLILCTEEFVTDLTEYAEGGLPDAIVIHNTLVELDVLGNEYWRWSTYDHLNVTDATENVSLSKVMIDLVHANSIFETSDGNILISMRNYDEIAKINKTDGKFIWRLGGSKCANNQFAFTNDKIDGFTGFSHQHAANILPNGNLLLYDNGNLKPKNFSRAVEYSINETNRTVTKVWEYRSSPDIFSPALGSAYRLPNGNTLINWGTDKITEVKPDKSIAFEITYDGGNVYNAKKITSHAIYASHQLINPANYVFNNGTKQTDVTIQVTNISAAAKVHVQKHLYPPHSGSFNDSSFSDVFSYRWVLSNDNPANLTGKFKIASKNLVGVSNPGKTTIYKRDKEAIGQFNALNTTYNKSTDEIIADFSGFGEFVLVSNVLSKPILLSPSNREKVAISGEFSWQHVKGALNYQLQLDISDKFTAPYKNVVISKINTHQFANLKPRTKYFWRVRAINTKDTSAWSDIFSMTTMNQPPTLISPLDNAIGTFLADSLTWEKQLDTDTYKLQIASTNDFNNPMINISNHKTPFFLLKSLDNETKYFWRVAINIGNEPPEWSEVRSFTTTFEAPSLNIPQNMLNNITIPITFEWTSSSKVDFFKFELSYKEDFSHLVYVQSDLKAPFIKLNDLSMNTNYYWRVQSQKNQIHSDWSVTNSFKTALKMPKLVEPINSSVNHNSTVDLNWELTHPDIHYQVQVSGKNDFSILFADVYLNNTDHHQLTGLPINSRYFWRVRAINGKDSSQWSMVWNFRTKLAKPILLTPLNGRTNFSLYSPLRWEKYQTITHYSIQIAQDPDFNNPFIDSIVYGNEFFILKLIPNTQYYWRVKAHKDTLFSDWSLVRTFTTDDGLGINPPELLNPIDGSEIYIDGYLVWEDVADGASYHLQVSEDYKFDNLIIDKMDLKDVGYRLHNLQYDMTYYWRVRVYGKFAHSEWSTANSFNTIDENNRIQLISPEDYEIGLPLNLNMSWENVEEADYYELQLSHKSNMSTLIINNQSVYDNSYLCQNLTANSQYYWRVRSTIGNQKSAWSPIWSFVTKSITPLSIPRIISPENKSTTNSILANFEWEEVQNATWYKFVLAKNTKFTNIVMKYPDLNNSKLNCCELDFGTTYYWRVAAFNDTSSSPWSQTYSFLTELAPPEIIYPSDNSNAVSTEINFIWQSANKHDFYNLQLAFDPEFEYLFVDTADLVDTQYNCLLSPLTNYYARVKSYNDTNSSSWSRIVSFSTSNTTSTKEFGKFADDLFINNYPNPLSLATTFIFTNSNPGYAEIKLFDILGNYISTVFSAYAESGTHRILWNSKNLNSGVYYYCLTTSSNVKYGKLIIIK